MRLPFGLDLKSVLVGAVLVYFALPWVTGLLAGFRAKSAKE